jgi:hypothetical protein
VSAQSPHDPGVAAVRGAKGTHHRFQVRAGQNVRERVDERGDRTASGQGFPEVVDTRFALSGAERKRPHVRDVEFLILESHSW